jgi:hypothetical protein
MKFTCYIFSGAGFMLNTALGAADTNVNQIGMACPYGAIIKEKASKHSGIRDQRGQGTYRR